MIYRDQIRLSDIGEIPANVKVIAAGEVWRNGLTEFPERQAITVTVPVWGGVNAGDIESFTWRGSSYTVESQAVPIVALGRVDHYELMATRSR